MFRITLELFFFLFLIVIGSLFAFWTNKVVRYARKRYTDSPKWVQAFPFAGLVLSRWYPAYIRLVGIFCWITALLFAYLALIAKLWLV
jgi:hypothetical protein